MNEAETRAEHIDPALQAAGWGVVAGSRIRREYAIAPGRREGPGRPGPALKADYVLEYRNRKLAVIEAKAWDAALTEGVAQSKNYAGKLAVRFAYATNGQGIYEMDMTPGQPGQSGQPRPPEREIAAYPTPPELWAMTFAKPNAWRDRFAAVPFEDKGGTHPTRYYQDIAVERVMDAIADQRTRILLTLATGTGKTFIAFQIAWKLFHARWNLSREPTRRPRILFLADRNILANQAYNAFSAFPEDALVRIEPDVIRKQGKAPKNGSLFFTIFQTFMVADAKAVPGPHPATQVTCQPLTYPLAAEEDRVPQAWAAEPPAIYSAYPPDFFDFIVVDECHRGGANDESTWRGILEYFAPAVQLGLTATPKRDENVDTYRYFGDPVYVYSLKEGINDGFLTPFKVKQIQTTLDDYVYTPDDTVVEGEIEPGKRYEEADFNRIIEIRKREEYRVRLFMEQINQHEKTLVFCANQAHALAVRDLVNQLKASPDPNYCQRVTANDGELGEQHLRDFQDMLMTSFWHPDGTPMSAQQFMELLFGKLPEFFKDEAELRAIWSAPDTRKQLLQGLAEKGFGHDQLAEMQQIIAAEKSDLFDVLAYVAYALPPVTREVRAANARVHITTRFSAKQQLFLDFVLQHYITVGVEELDQEKLTPLLLLKYHNSLADAVADLGGRPAEIHQAFAGFQKYLYQQTPAA